MSLCEFNQETFDKMISELEVAEKLKKEGQFPRFVDYISNPFHKDIGISDASFQQVKRILCQP